MHNFKARNWVIVWAQMFHLLHAPVDNYDLTVLICAALYMHCKDGFGVIGSSFCKIFNYHLIFRVAVQLC